MELQTDNQALYEAACRLFQDYSVKEREYYQLFRKHWTRLFENVLDSNESYMPDDPQSVLTVHHSFSGVEMDFHFDQLKMANWYQQDASAKKNVVFVPKRLNRARNGLLTFHNSICTYDPEEPESALTDSMKNIFACAMPSLPPSLCIVYGNKWVNSRFNVLRQRSLPLFLIQTDYVPAFLCSQFEICMYLFLMDFCIIRENYKKVKDEDLQQFLHIFKSSPMLRVKGLLTEIET